MKTIYACFCWYTKRYRKIIEKKQKSKKNTRIYILLFLLSLFMLYVIPTPIGNKEDITMRAIRLLKECTIFLCEDTQTTKKICNMYDISLEWKQFFPFTSFSDERKIAYYCDLIQTSDVCMTSEAGTPWLSDPGKSIIKICRERSLPFTILPGATALIPAVVWSYTDTSTFHWYWFIPTKKGRQTVLRDIMQTCMHTPCFFYESVHRVEKLLRELDALWFSGTVAIHREISKVFEQKIQWTPAELLTKIQNNHLIIKGEFVIGMRETKSTLWSYHHIPSHHD